MNSYSLAERINSDVNASVTWMSDQQQFGIPEFWCEARSGFDDCDGYALLKRALLKEQGFDEDKIHIATCCINVKADDTGHCVLIVETDKGQFILDNNLKDHNGYSNVVVGKMIIFQQALSHSDRLTWEATAKQYWSTP